MLPTENLQRFLITNGLGRDPFESGVGPTLWIEPKNGLVAPGIKPGDNASMMDPDLTVGISRDAGVPSEFNEGFIRRIRIDFKLYARKAPFAQEWEPRLYNLIHDAYQYDLNQVVCLQSHQFADLSPLLADNTGFQFITRYMFWLWAVDVV